MKDPELRAAANCAVCHQPFGHTGLPTFWRVRIERHGIIMRAIQHQDGLAMQLGSARLAQVMGANEDLTQPLMDPVQVTVCEHCAVEAVIHLRTRHLR